MSDVQRRRSVRGLLILNIRGVSDVFAVAAVATALGFLGREWFVDRWEDVNGQYEIEEKAVR